MSKDYDYGNENDCIIVKRTMEYDGDANEQLYNVTTVCEDLLGCEEELRL